MLRTARAVFFCGIAGRLSTPPQFGKMSSDMQLSLFLSGNSSGIPEKVQFTKREFGGVIVEPHLEEGAHQVGVDKPL